MTPTAGDENPMPETAQSGEVLSPTERRRVFALLSQYWHTTRVQKEYKRLYPGERVPSVGTIWAYRNKVEIRILEKLDDEEMAALARGLAPRHRRLDLLSRYVYGLEELVFDETGKIRPLAFGKDSAGVEMRETLAQIAKEIASAPDILQRTGGASGSTPGSLTVSGVVQHQWVEAAEEQFRNLPPQARVAELVRLMKEAAQAGQGNAEADDSTEEPGDADASADDGTNRAVVDGVDA